MCLQRIDMPQVDDLAGLQVFLARRGVHVDTVRCPPHWLSAKQCLDPLKAYNERILTIPLLVSEDRYIIDGNHRWMAHCARHTAVIECFVVRLPFDEARTTVLSFPAAYTKGVD